MFRLPFLTVHPSIRPSVPSRSERTRDDFAYVGESSVDHYARRRWHTPIRLETCCWSSSAIDIGSRDRRENVLFLSLSPWSDPCTRERLIILTIYLVLLLARYLRSHDVTPIHDCAVRANRVGMFPRDHRHRHRVVAIAPVINMRERASASTHTRNSFNELDFAGRTNSFLHLHSVLAVNHFSARVTRHDGEKVEFD